MSHMTSLWEGLQAARHIDRERAVTLLKKKLKSAEDAEKVALLEEAAENVRRLMLLDFWEARHGGFLAAKVILSHSKDGAFEGEILKLALDYLDDPEAHVRLAVAECVFVLARSGNDDIFVAARDPIMQRIEDNLEREAASDGTSTDDDVSGDVPSPSANPRANPAQSGVRSMYRPHSWAQKAELAATMGSLQRLETSFKTLQRLLEGRAEAPVAPSDPDTPLVDARIRAAINRALLHKNRFVRETGFYTLRALFGGSLGAGLEDGAAVAEMLAAGLGDNWSQVRYAASVATRAFVVAAGADAPRFYSTLLPPMCLNRHYIAEGVRIYSQETWKLAMGTNGRGALAEIAPATAAYYVKQCGSANYAVREAACHCMGELSTKVDPARVAPQVGGMLRALLPAMADVNWPVREAACAASGQCVLTFPEEARASRDQLLPTWLSLLRDSIPSVRESAAVAVGCATAAYKDEVAPQVLSELPTLLSQAKRQPSDGAQNGAEGHREPDSAAPATNGSAASLSATCPNPDGEAECPQPNRTGEPWEASEGGIYLLRELSAVLPERVPEFLPTLAELGHCTCFERFPDLLDTLWKQLPVIAKNMGKKRFKAYLELFLDPLFWALTCRQRLVESAAGYCVSELQELIGATIFRARLDDHQRAALDSSPFVGPPALQAQSAAVNRTIIKSATSGSSGLQFGAPIMLPPRTRPE